MKDFPDIHFMKMWLKNLKFAVEQIDEIEKFSLRDLTLKEVQDLAKTFFAISFVGALFGGFIWLFTEGVEFGMGNFVFDGMPNWTGELLYLVFWMGIGYFILSKSHGIIFHVGCFFIGQSIRIYRLSPTMRIFVVALIGVCVWLFHNFQYAGFLFLLGILFPASVTYELYWDLLVKKAQGMYPSEPEEPI